MVIIRCLRICGNCCASLLWFWYSMCSLIYALIYLYHVLISYISILYTACVNIPDDTYLCIYFMVLGVSSCCVVCLDYKHLLSSIESVFFILCVAIWCLILATFWILGYIHQYVCHLFANLFLLAFYIWYISNVCRCFPFFSIFIILIVSIILPYMCPILNMRFEYPELLLLFFIYFHQHYLHH
jgi:hypothetical protein